MAKWATTELSRKYMNIIQKMPFLPPVILGKLYCSVELAPVYRQPPVAGLPLRSRPRVRSPMRPLSTIPSDLKLVRRRTLEHGQMTERATSITMRGCWRNNAGRCK
jgi:hypothetical protein